MPSNYTPTHVCLPASEGQGARQLDKTATKSSSIFVYHVTPARGKKMAAIPDDCERTATVALPTAASLGFISGEVRISAALDAFSTVYQLQLTGLESRQTYYIYKLNACS